MKPKLIIACITYNHENYIAQTLESFVIQKTNFPFEVYVADDCSTDKTPFIISEFVEKYPDLIKPMFRVKNVGVWQNWIEMADKIKSKYVALCEGDDYWIDEYKLQKQVDFLESNKEFAIAFHPVKVKWEDKRQSDVIFPSSSYRFNKTHLTIADLQKHNFIQTNSVVYRWRFIEDNIYDFLPKDIIPIDYFIHMLHAQKGNIYFQDELMSVYRRHEQGIWTGAGKSIDWYKRNLFKHINFYLAMEQQFNLNYSKELIKLVESALLCFCRSDDYVHIKKIKKYYPKIYDEVIGQLRKYDFFSLKLLFKLLFYKSVGLINNKIAKKCIKLESKVKNSKFILKSIQNNKL